MTDLSALIRKQANKLTESLTRRTHFSATEVEALFQVYRKLSEGIEIDRLDRNRFREFLHNSFDMTDDILLDRIFKHFDSDNDSFINREEWVQGLSIFLRGK